MTDLLIAEKLTLENRSLLLKKLQSGVVRTLGALPISAQVLYAVIISSADDWSSMHQQQIQG